MSDLTEHLTLRLTTYEFNAVNKMANDNFVSKSTMIRKLINEKNATDENLIKKMLIEVLIILRQQTDDEKLDEILSAVDAFKQQHNIV